MRNAARFATIALLTLAACKVDYDHGDDDVVVVVPPPFFGDPDIETFLSEGREHVPEGSVIFYLTNPPTSGAHYPVPALGGFYGSDIAPGYLVAALENGAVVIYYNPFTVTAAEQLVLADMANANPGDFDQIIAVPRV